MMDTKDIDKRLHDLEQKSHVLLHDATSTALDSMGVGLAALDLRIKKLEQRQSEDDAELAKTAGG